LQCSIATFDDISEGRKEPLRLKAVSIPLAGVGQDCLFVFLSWAGLSDLSTIGLANTVLAMLKFLVGPIHCKLQLPLKPRSL
jgi:hypothetical protein